MDHVMVRPVGGHREEQGSLLPRRRRRCHDAFLSHRRVPVQRQHLFREIALVDRHHQLRLWRVESRAYFGFERFDNDRPLRVFGIFATAKMFTGSLTRKTTQHSYSK
jgi:hypothetical protein